MATCISIKKLSKCYGSTVAVGGLSLEVEAGEVMGLLGPNGAGKSTTINILAGLVYPSSGQIMVLGQDLYRHSLSIRKRMGVLLERPGFYEHLTVRQNMKMQARLAQCEVNIDRVLARLGLVGVAHQRVAVLSHGIRQRLGLAQAMLTEPEILLLDEPTLGLDVESAQEILNLLRRLASEAHVTILMSSHLMHEAEQICDRVAVLKEGALVACESTKALLSYDRSRLEVVMEGAERAAKRLLEQPWVLSAGVRNGRLQVQLRGDNAHQLTSFLVSSGYPVGGVIPRQRTLQEYLLKVLNRQEGRE